MSSSEDQLTGETTVVTSQDDPGTVDETGPVITSSEIQTEDSGNVTGLSDVQPAMEVVADTAAAPEEKPTANDGNSSVCETNDDGRRSTPEKADSDVSAECSRTVTTKSRGGRSYQESRRSKKTAGEKSKSISGTSKCERTRELVDAHGVGGRCFEQRGKGDVQEAGMQQENSMQHVKDSVCHPTCDGDPPASVNVIIDEHDMRKRYTLLSAHWHMSVNTL